MKNIVFLTLFSVMILSAAQKCSETKSVSVTGLGKVKFVPDIATFKIAVFARRSTTPEATKLVGSILSTVQSILFSNGVPRNGITTSQIKMTPSFQSVRGNRTLSGQQSSQIVSVQVSNLTDHGSGLFKLLDQLHQVSGIRVSKMKYDISNRKQIEEQARNMALEDAKWKAKELATRLNLTLASPITITESEKESLGQVSEAPTSSIQEGYEVEEEIEVGLRVVWELV